jgi:hypothetical protein
MAALHGEIEEELLPAANEAMAMVLRLHKEKAS